MPTIYKEEALQELSKTSLPKHIAIIPDGNRRWAKEHGQSSFNGHKMGAKALVQIGYAAKELGVKYLTVYTFSTENWKRAEKEVVSLLGMVKDLIQHYTDELISQGVRLKVIGDRTSLPEELQKQIEVSEKATSVSSDLTLTLAVNYGARSEILRATSKMSEKSEENFSSALDTAALPDPDLLIRTGGEYRLSNFLLWQLSYTELYFTKTLWPDFSPKDLLQAMVEYQNREQRRGE